jgi:hypothetical protein
MQGYSKSLSVERFQLSPPTVLCVYILNVNGIGIWLAYASKQTIKFNIVFSFK